MLTTHLLLEELHQGGTGSHVVRAQSCKLIVQDLDRLVSKGRNVVRIFGLRPILKVILCVNSEAV